MIGAPYTTFESQTTIATKIQTLIRLEFPKEDWVCPNCSTVENSAFLSKSDLNAKLIKADHFAISAIICLAYG